MGKKDKNEMAEQKKYFLSGSNKKGIPEEKAKEIFDQ